MGYGIRVVLVMNRKGGSGKSTLCRALASAAAARGETVTIFDTDSSKSCLNWMQAGQKLGNWSPSVAVIHTLDAHRVGEAIDQIYEQSDQDHLILIDTFGGGSEAQDVLAVAAYDDCSPLAAFSLAIRSLHIFSSREDSVLASLRAISCIFSFVVGGRRKDMGRSLIGM